MVSERSGESQDQEGSIQTNIITAGSLLPAITLACGLAIITLSALGADDGLPAGQKAVDETQYSVSEALRAQGIGEETASGGYVAGGDFANGESAFIGERLDPPPWLPAGFPLPEDLSITMITSDKDSNKAMSGRSASVSQSELASRASEWADGQGWEVLLSTDRKLTLVSPAGEVLDVLADDGYALELQLSRRDLSSERQDIAVERRLPGVARVKIAVTDMELQGECALRGSSYLFEYTAQDGTIYASVQIQNADSTPSGSASFMQNEGDRYTQYSISFPMYGGEEPSVRASSNDFSVGGSYASINSAGMTAVKGDISVRCGP